MLTRTRKAVAITTFLIAIAMVLSVSAWAQDRADFSFRAIDGGTVTSESLRGQVVVLAFGASWLPLTNNQMDAVKKLGDRYASRGVLAYWVSTDSENLKSKNFVADDELRRLARKYNVKVLRDPDGVISKKLGVDQLPSVVIIDKRGNISGTAGGLDPNVDLAKQLATRLDKIL
jgi:cytochrome c biogenesis protein CcmG, thiol:disulfide interchange protein DsbE